MSSILRPAYKLKAGGEEFSLGTLAPLIALDVRLAKNAGADGFVAILGQTGPFDIRAGDDVALELGWDGDTRRVFTGTVESMAPGADATRLEAVGNQALLARSRGDTAYADQSAGQVVAALCGEAGVEVETADDGLDLPQYLADSARDRWDHCLALARRCGFDLYCNAEGKLVFSAFNAGSADHKFHFGIDLLAADMYRNPALPAVAVVPESPASSQGSDSASWLVKDPSPNQGRAGDGEGLVVSDPLLRSKDAADTAAKARLYRSRRDAQGGVIGLMGNAEVALGQAVELIDLPGDGADGMYQVMAVRHSLGRATGFRTWVTLGGMP
jgi:phage protein D